MAVILLYATDGSPCARKAGRLLAALPVPAEARVNVLGVMPLFDWVDSPLFAEWSLQEEKAAYEHLDEMAAVLHEHGIASEVTVRRGNAPAVILDQAEADRTDLIVAGSHGRGGMERLLIGSVSERVARYAHCSVLVARGDTLQRAILAVDGSESAERALDAVVRLPLPADLALTIVQVIPLNELSAPDPSCSDGEYETLTDKDEAQRRERAQTIVGRAEQALRSAGRAADVSIRCGAPAEQIIAAARESGSDLVVVGAANRSALGRLFLGSISARVLSHAPCSVLIARSGVPEGAG